MGKRPRKKKLFSSDLKKKAPKPHPVFNFFKGCQNSTRPEWGPSILKFKIPGSVPDNEPT
jgi:hypothetical protein